VQNQQPPYADIILPLAIHLYYTYTVPDRLQDKVFPGCRVTVVLGQRKIYTGIVRQLHNNPPEGIKLSEILSVLDEKPLVSLKQLEFWEWIADYYLCTPGEVFRAALPSGLKLESESRIFPVKSSDVPDSYTLSELQLLDLVTMSPGITIQKLASASGKKDILPVLKILMEKSAIVREENLKSDYKPRYQDYILLTNEFCSTEKLNELSEKLENKAPRQSDVLLKLIEMGGLTDEQIALPVRKEKLLKASSAGHVALNSLIKKGVLKIRSEEVSRLTLPPDTLRKPYALNENQIKAHLKIIEEFKEKDVVLLHGVTSSGKTEIYIHLIEHFIREDKQVLYLLPEIALTVQMIQRLRAVFGDTVGVYHSKFSDAERVEVYENLAGLRKKNSPSYQIILGVRSSVFLPFSNLGLIIIDEEHEKTYKQFDPAPRYNARDASVVLASMHKAKVLMGTATPSFESYLNAFNSRYGLVELSERYLNIQLPEIVVIDTREARKRKLMQTHFAASMLEAITEALKGNEQVILFQNRRGFSPYIECNACGWIPRCKHCDVSLTYHKKTNRLNCHYCGFSIPNPHSCSSCGDTDLRTRGFGTEKVEDEIKVFFPEAVIARMDLDTTRTRKSYERIIDDFSNRKVDILIGTQMISKGLDFDHVSMVGILNADNMLNFPDFRSFERSFQLIAQVSGRAGRKKGRGKVIIQTSDPEHTVIRHILENDYQGFFKQQLRERQTFKYPPYYRLVKLTLRHKKLPIVSQAADLLAIELQKTLGERVVGPEFPLISRLFSMHQKCILVKIERDKLFSQRRKYMRQAIDKIMIRDEFKSLQIVPDVDPYN
jgi:primosomal protein N' (replication factor Y)